MDPRRHALVAEDGAQEVDECSASDGDATSDVNDDEGYNLRMFGISQALPVAELAGEFGGGEPQSAEEYLAWVRHEASQCPQVVRVEISAEKLASGARASASAPDTSDAHATAAARSSLPPCADWARPSAGWARGALRDFRALRAQLSGLGCSGAHADELGAASAARLPGPYDGRAWDALVFGRGRLDDGSGGGQGGSDAGLGPGSAADGAAAGGAMGASAPLLRTVQAMDQVRVVALLTRLVDGMATGDPSGGNTAGASPESSGGPSLSYACASWLHALLAALDKPLHGDTGACVRGLARACAGIRAGIAQQGDPQLPTLNLLIVVAGGYFGQDQELGALLAGEELP